MNTLAVVLLFSRSPGGGPFLFIGLTPGATLSCDSTLALWVNRWQKQYRVNKLLYVQNQPVGQPQQSNSHQSSLIFLCFAKWGPTRYGQPTKLGTVKISFSARKIACIAAERFSNSSTPPPAVLNVWIAGYRGTNLLWITQKRALSRDRALAHNDFDLCSTKTFCCEQRNYKLSPWPTKQRVWGLLVMKRKHKCHQSNLHTISECYTNQH